MAHQRKPFWTLDCESDPFHACTDTRCTKCENPGPNSRGRIPKPFLWGLYGGPNGDDYYEFENGGDAVEFLSRHRHVVYAHNGGKFDYHYLRDHINTGQPISIIAGRLARFNIGECEFRDSMNILPVALAAFKKDEVDYSLFEPDVRDIPKNKETIRKYLRSDCTYLYELISAHRAENGVALTQAGASMLAWSKQSGIAPPRQSGARYQQYKPYYYGGRVQCFESGNAKKGFKVYDINSAYPKAMTHPHPFSVAGTHQSRLPRDSELHKCMITLDCVARGCFPFRMGDDPTKGDLYFPDDERTVRRYHITGYEFITALRRDAIKPDSISIRDVHYFEESVKFEEFIYSNWDRRAEAKRIGNKALDIIIKLLMNSLYGKFASDYAKYKEYYLAHLDDVLRYVGERDVDVNWRVLNTSRGDAFAIDTVWGNERRLMSRPIPENKHRFYNIATAASITGFVRAQLFEAICDVSGPIYSDTDSLACLDASRLSLGDGLGQWKMEGEFDAYSIAGKKTYAFHKLGHPDGFETDHRGDYLHWKVASKGVDLNPAEIQIAARGDRDIKGKFVGVEYRPEVPTYSVKKQVPQFINREVRLTAKDIRRVPDECD